jgi:hypothetical protein
MTHLEAFLEQTWDGILSRDAAKVDHVFAGLNEENRKVVVAHLHKMAEEAGWHPAQVESARFALNVIEPKKGED